jgi:hypothetical protein
MSDEPLVEASKPLGKNISAAIALVISLCTAAFSIYQWWTGQREARIVAAIEVSNKQLEKRDESLLLTIAKWYSNRGIESVPDYMRIAAHYDELEYIAFLANKDRVDKDYLSMSVVCDIVLTEGAMNNIKKKVPELSKFTSQDMSDFSKSAKCDAAQFVNELLAPLSN